MSEELNISKITDVSWEVRQAPAINSKDFDIYKIGVPASAGKIARVPGREGRNNIVAANARLISAAPDMRDALKALLTAKLMKESDDPDYEKYKKQALKMAEKALFKANGIES